MDMEIIEFIIPEGVVAGLVINFHSVFKQFFGFMDEVHCRSAPVKMISCMGTVSFIYVTIL